VAWYLNYYTCDRCDRDWTDEWSCTCDDDCPHCGFRHMSPTKSEDLTYVIERQGNEFVVLWSPNSAGDEPEYCELTSFPTQQQAEGYLSTP
jgi:DNA-directed RNA polymerase subunit RPC12/RpoP